MALVLEAQSVRNLLDRKRGGPQQRLGFSNQDFVDAVASGAARHLFHHIGHIRGRQVQFIGIPFDVVMLVAALIHKDRNRPVNSSARESGFCEERPSVKNP